MRGCGVAACVRKGYVHAAVAEVPSSSSWGRGGEGEVVSRERAGREGGHRVEWVRHCTAY